MEIHSNSKQEFKVIFVMNEQEAAALHDIVAYGYKSFMEVFKEKLGEHYIKKHEVGCKSLFEAVYSEMPKHLARFEEARKIFDTSKYTVK